jgi:hypothetical protein
VEGEQGKDPQRDPLKELEARVDAAIEEVRPKVKRAMEELDARLDAAMADIRPKVDNAMEEVRPRVDKFLVDVQPRLDSILKRMESKIGELRRDLEDRAAREGPQAPAGALPPADQPPDPGPEGSSESSGPGA